MLKAIRWVYDNGVLPVGYTLMILFFLISFLKKSVMFEFMNWETVISCILRMIVVKFVMEQSYEMIIMIFDVTSGIMSNVDAMYKEYLKTHVVEMKVEVPVIPDLVNFVTPGVNKLNDAGNYIVMPTYNLLGDKLWVNDGDAMNEYYAALNAYNDAKFLYDQIMTIGAKAANRAAMETALISKDTLELIAILVCMLPLFVGMMLARIVVRLVVYGRLLQLFVLMLIAPMPLSTLVSEEHADVGIGFLKQLIATSLQGLVIIVICIVFEGVQQAVTGVDVGDNMWSTFFFNAMLSLLIALSLWKSGEFTKKVLGTG